MKTLNKLRTEGIFLILIKGMYGKTTDNIIVNGKKKKRKIFPYLR